MHHGISLIPTSTVMGSGFNGVGSPMNVIVYATGHSKRFCSIFLRQQAIPASQVYDIVAVLHEYVHAARPERGKQCFHVPRLVWSLTPAQYNLRLRSVAKKHGLDPNRVHSHSVRIGGATVLVAALVPDYVIMAMGEWAFAVYLQYVHPSVQLYAAAQAALANPTFLTA